MCKACSAPSHLNFNNSILSRPSAKTVQFRNARHLQKHTGICACAIPGKPQILKEPATRDAKLGELLVELTGLPTRHLQQLVDLGAVYYGDPECPSTPPKWRRAKRLGANAMGQPISEVATLLSLLNLLHAPSIPTGRFPASR